MQLVLLRHGESQWNLENRFTGWTDVELSDTGRQEAAAAGKAMQAAGLDFDVCFTSCLKRAIHTLDLALDAMDRCWLPVYKSWKLNERHYGALQGLNKAETAEKFGEEQVHIWRRAYDVRPPMLGREDQRNPALQPAYRRENGQLLPLGESLADTVARTVPYFEQQILPRMQNGERVLIAAHGNSLRALILFLEKMTPEQIMKVNLPTGIPLVYRFDETLALKEKTYIGDPELIKKKIEKVAGQGKIQAGT